MSPKIQENFFKTLNLEENEKCHLYKKIQQKINCQFGQTSKFKEIFLALKKPLVFIGVRKRCESTRLYLLTMSTDPSQTHSA
jgi:hypothetical protein